MVGRRGDSFLRTGSALYMDPARVGCRCGDGTLPSNDQAAVEEIDLVVALEGAFDRLDGSTGGVGKYDGGDVVLMSLAEAGGERRIAGDLFVPQAELATDGLREGTDRRFAGIGLSVPALTGGEDEAGFGDAALRVRDGIGVGCGVPSRDLAIEVELGKGRERVRLNGGDDAVREGADDQVEVGFDAANVQNLAQTEARVRLGERGILGLNFLKGRWNALKRGCPDYGDERSGHGRPGRGGRAVEKDLELFTAHQRLLK
jgi:hypothetical protein